jgi:predicted AAA+ superfamily ATPase
VARDAVTVIPVQAAEIAKVLAKRLFTDIDQQAARETAEAYMAMYCKSAAALPDRASREDFREALVAHYPFHPTFIEFLNQKLATVETFQGTRGVLRVLALAVRSLWQER